MINCPVCKSNLISLKFKKNQYVINKCKNCRVEFIYPPPTEKELSTMYEDDQYHSKDRYDVDQEIETFNPIWIQRLDVIASLGFEKGTLLDIGCATGIFLKIAHEKGWNITGLEKSNNAARKALNFLGEQRVFVVDLLSFSPPKKYDVITLWALIEHVENPKDYFRKVHEMLKTGGLVGLSTPNLNSLSRFILNQQWRYYIPPEHLIYFNKKSLATLFELTGFKIVKTKTHFKHIAFFKRNSRLLNLYKTNRKFRVFLKLIWTPIELACKFLYLGETLEIYGVKK